MEKKTYAASDQTKHALAAALKELMAHKPLEKITIHEITERCGMRRQNFYYHFEDIYDLLHWMFEEEAMVLLRQHEGALLWQEGCLQLFQYLWENRAVCLCALKSLGHEHLKRFFEAEIYTIIHNTIEQIGQSIGIKDGAQAQVDIDLLTHFFVTALAGMMESWLLGELDQTPEELVAFVDTLLQDYIRGVLGRVSSSAEHKET